MDGLRLLSTSNGGVQWQIVPLPVITEEIAKASLQFTDTDSGSLTLKLASGNSFHRSREFVTQDGGLTWHGGEIISLPVRESKRAVSQTGGNLPDSAIFVDWYDQYTAWALSREGTCLGSKIPVGSPIIREEIPWQCQLQTQLWMTVDGGLTWQDITPISNFSD
jgi:hypothetical protein